MASPQIHSAASTPSSAGSPANIAPAPPTLAIKPMPNNAHMMLMPSPGSCESPISLGPKKEWIIPPRPKPGRKPATDTPPTKRKAQNRAAQRAFRERRAARVGELEEQLKETEEERLKREALMKAELDEARTQITKLEADLRRVIDEAIEWRQRHQKSEEMLEMERKEKEALNTELVYLRNGARSTGTNAVALPPRRKRGQQKNQAISTPQNIITDSEPDPLGCGNCTSTGGCACVEQAMTMATSSCGRCSPDTHCECLEETLKGPIATSNPPEVDMKRAFSSSSPIDHNKRPRLSIEETTTSQEIDFTALFSSKPIQISEQPSRDYVSDITTSRPPPGETCGFCDDSTYCACAEAAAVAAREQEMENRLPPLMNEVTPPPSDTDVNTSETYKLPSLYPNHHVHQSINSSDSQSQRHNSASKPSTNSCVNGPGTCQQCQDDPKSGLFCRSLAAIRAADPTFSGCCGQGGPGGCCKDQSSASKPGSSEARALPPGAALSCADTYKTLSSHRNFEAASDELSQWMPKLARVAQTYPGRGAMDIDAASVMSVIKYFDVRFGRE